MRDDKYLMTVTMAYERRQIAAMKTLHMLMLLHLINFGQVFSDSLRPPSHQSD